jgi:hypothetical protein
MLLRVVFSIYQNCEVTLWLTTCNIFINKGKGGKVFFNRWESNPQPLFLLNNVLPLHYEVTLPITTYYILIFLKNVLNFYYTINII